MNFNMKNILSDSSYRDIDDFMKTGNDGIALLGHENGLDVNAIDVVNRFQTLADPTCQNLESVDARWGNVEGSTILEAGNDAPAGLNTYTDNEYNSFAVRNTVNEVLRLRYPITGTRKSSNPSAYFSGVSADFASVKNMYEKAFNVQIFETPMSANVVKVNQSALSALAQNTKAIVKKAQTKLKLATKFILKSKTPLCVRADLRSKKLLGKEIVQVANALPNTSISSAEKIIALVDFYNKKAVNLFDEQTGHAGFGKDTKAKKMRYASQLLADVFVCQAIDMGGNGEANRRADNALKLQLSNVLAGLNCDKNDLNIISANAQDVTQLVMKNLGLKQENIIANREEYLGLTYKNKPANLYDTLFGSVNNADYKYVDALIPGEGSVEFLPEVNYVGDSKFYQDLYNRNNELIEGFGDITTPDPAPTPVNGEPISVVEPYDPGPEPIPTPVIEEPIPVFTPEPAPIDPADEHASDLWEVEGRNEDEAKLYFYGKEDDEEPVIEDPKPTENPDTIPEPEPTPSPVVGTSIEIEEDEEEYQMPQRMFENSMPVYDEDYPEIKKDAVEPEPTPVVEPEPVEPTIEEIEPEETKTAEEVVEKTQPVKPETKTNSETKVVANIKVQNDIKIDNSEVTKKLDELIEFLKTQQVKNEENQKAEELAKLNEKISGLTYGVGKISDEVNALNQKADKLNETIASITDALYSIRDNQTELARKNRRLLGALMKNGEDMANIFAFAYAMGANANKPQPKVEVNNKHNLILVLNEKMKGKDNGQTVLDDFYHEPAAKTTEDKDNKFEIIKDIEGRRSIFSEIAKEYKKTVKTTTTTKNTTYFTRNYLKGNVKIGFLPPKIEEDISGAVIGGGEDIQDVTIIKNASTEFTREQLKKAIDKKVGEVVSKFSKNDLYSRSKVINKEINSLSKKIEKLKAKGKDITVFEEKLRNVSEQKLSYHAIQYLNEIKNTKDFNIANVNANNQTKIATVINGTINDFVENYLDDMLQGKTSIEKGEFSSAITYINKFSRKKMNKEDVRGFGIRNEIEVLIKDLLAKDYSRELYPQYSNMGEKIDTALLLAQALKNEIENSENSELEVVEDIIQQDDREEIPAEIIDLVVNETVEDVVQKVIREENKIAAKKKLLNNIVCETGKERETTTDIKEQVAEEVEVIATEVQETVLDKTEQTTLAKFETKKVLNAETLVKDKNNGKEFARQKLVKVKRLDVYPEKVLEVVATNHEKI